MKRSVLTTILVLLIALAAPAVASAQSASGSPAGSSPSASASAPAGSAAAVGAASASPASASSPAASAVPSASGAAAASPAASVPAGDGPPTPIGGNLAPPPPEPVSLFAYLLIVLAAIWFLIMAIWLVRLSNRPTLRGIGNQPVIIETAPNEKGRTFLTFGLPVAAAAVVAAIIFGWGNLFLYLSTIKLPATDGFLGDSVTLFMDLGVILAVMFIATGAAIAGGRRHPS